MDCGDVSGMRLHCKFVSLEVAGHCINVVCNLLS